MSSPAKGSTPENKSTKRQNPDDRLLSFCRLSIGVEGLAQQPLPDLHVEIAGPAGSGVGAGEISAALALRTDLEPSLATPRNSIAGLL
jgi:hypothetical protein